jgi:hypothetical protein
MERQQLFRIAPTSVASEREYQAVKDPSYAEQSTQSNQPLFNLHCMEYLQKKQPFTALISPAQPVLRCLSTLVSSE